MNKQKQYSLNGCFLLLLFSLLLLYDDEFPFYIIFHNGSGFFKRKEVNIKRYNRYVEKKLTGRHISLLITEPVRRDKIQGNTMMRACGLFLVAMEVFFLRQ